MNPVFRLAVLRLIREADRLALGLSAATLFLLMAMTFLDVVMRSVFNAPIQAATELTRIMMAVAVFLALPRVSAGNRHIAVDLADPLFSRWRLARWRDGLVMLACGLALAWPVGHMAVLARRMANYGEVTEYLHIPVFPVFWFITGMTALAAAAMAVHGLLRLLAPRLLAPFE